MRRLAARTGRAVRAAAVGGAVIVTACLGLVACSDSGPRSLVEPTTVPAPVGFSDADNGRSATVSVGQRITVILHSSDFGFGPPSDPAVVRADGAATVTLDSDACVETPGSGCGTVVASFVGVGAGDATLQADRATCAEPACAPADAQWRLLLHVVAGVGQTTTSIAFGAEVRGTVLFSPVCPVESDPPDPACAPRPGPATVEVARLDGIVLAQDRTGDDGEFSMVVPVGTYTVKGFGPRSAVGGSCQSDPPEVTVEPDTSTTVAVSCDTGIR